MLQELQHKNTCIELRGVFHVKFNFCCTRATETDAVLSSVFLYALASYQSPNRSVALLEVGL